MTHGTDTHSDLRNQLDRMGHRIAEHGAVRRDGQGQVAGSRGPVRR